MTVRPETPAAPRASGTVGNGPAAESTDQSGIPVAGSEGSAADTGADDNADSSQPDGRAADQTIPASPSRTDASTTSSVAATQTPPAATVAPAAVAPSSAIEAVLPAAIPTISVPAPAPVPTAPAAPIASYVAQEPVAAQLAGPIASLRTAGDGEHVMVIRVSPDSIGPVRVLAHLSADGVRIELLGGTDQAREALQAALPDLRRDLAVVGLKADLSLTARDLTGANAGSGFGLGGQGSPGTRGEAGGSGRGVPAHLGTTAGSGARAEPPPDLARAAGSRNLDITI